MSVMRGGRVFEKLGVKVSTDYGTLGDRAQAAMMARKGSDSGAGVEPVRGPSANVQPVAAPTSPATGR